VRISLEQLIVADPQMIPTWDRNFFRHVGNDPLRAVREKPRLLPPRPLAGSTGPPLSIAWWVSDGSQVSFIRAGSATICGARRASSSSSCIMSTRAKPTLNTSSLGREATRRSLPSGERPLGGDRCCRRLSARRSRSLTRIEP
jgi:hypothetical protein